MKVVFDCNNLIYMKGARNTIVRKENVVIQKVFLKLTRNKIRHLEGKETQNTVHVVKGIRDQLENRRRNVTGSDDKHLNGVYNVYSAIREQGGGSS